MNITHFGIFSKFWDNESRTMMMYRSPARPSTKDSQLLKKTFQTQFVDF